MENHLIKLDEWQLRCELRELVFRVSKVVKAELIGAFIFTIHVLCVEGTIHILL